MSKAAGSTSFFLARQAGAQTVDRLYALLESSQHEFVASAVARGEQFAALVVLADGGGGLLVLEPANDGLQVQLLRLTDVHVAPGLAKRLLGVRRQQVHDLCSDLAAARLNGELAQRVLQREGEVDPTVVEALAAVQRASAAVETGLRDLQDTLRVALDAKADP